MKIGFLSLGCPKNLVDGEVMMGIARDAGHEITPDSGASDVLVVNTCAFIDSAKEESINAILEMAALKRGGKCSRLVVTGCLAERYRDELRREIPEIDALLGTGEVPKILEAINPPGGSVDREFGGSGGRAGRRVTDVTEAQAVTLYRRKPHARSAAEHLQADAANGSATTDRPNRRTPEPTNPRFPAAPSAIDYLYDADSPRLLTTPRHYAYIKVAEGCDYTCAFCIIPTLRGSYRSRTIESVVREAEGLAARGVRELLLISQDTSFYGIDRGERGGLARLLRALDRIDGLTWIRLLYLYPTTISDDVLEAMADCGKVCRYIDLPLQHASAAVLKRMRRPGDRRTYDKLLARIRSRVPGVTLRTTFIVGFPGESDDDFAELESFVADTHFDHVGVFTYSHEEDTRAYSFDDDVPARIKQKRRDALMRRQKRLIAATQKGRRGTEVDVMVDGRSPEHDLVVQGRTEGQAPDIDPVVYLTDCEPDQFSTGQLIRVRIVGAHEYDLIAAPARAGAAG